MDLTTKVYLTIDAGGTYLKSAILSPEGVIIKNSFFMTRSYSKGSGKMILQAFRYTVHHGIAMIMKSGLELEGIGIAIPGPFDYEKGIPLMEHKFGGIYGMDLRTAIQDIAGLSTVPPVAFIHDANAVLAGEIWTGNAQGYDNVALITLGTGLGFAFSQNGVIQLNKMGGPCLSIYKLPFRQGILEDYTAQRGFLEIYGELSGKSDTTGIKVSDIGRWADEGDKASLDTFLNVGEILAETLKDILIEKNIQCLLFGGQISRSFHHMENSLKSGLKEMKLLRKISQVKSIDNAAFYGALHEILKYSPKQPDQQK